MSQTLPSQFLLIGCGPLLVPRWTTNTCDEYERLPATKSSKLVYDRRVLATMKLVRAIKSLRLSLVERIIPRGYYVQGEPTFVSGELQTIEFPVAGYPEETQKFNKYLPGKKWEPVRDCNRWLLFRLLLSRVAALSTVDYAELGTYRGASARIIYEDMDPASTLYCFDT